MQYLDFEQDLAELDARIEELSKTNTQRGIDISKELERISKKKEKALKEAYKNLTPWQKSNVARHENRPHTKDYISALIKDFTVLSGDRAFADDHAIIGGIGKFNNQTVMVIGHEKGNDTDSRLYHNFGMAKPEGYRKAVRLMKLAEQFHIPVITFVDTAGAFPGIEGEERGQGQAIATGIDTCLNLRVPLISVIIGEGGSGGAIALAAGNAVLMLSNSIYSVISPEGCASILWKDFKYAPKAAEILHLTAPDLLKFGIIDEIIEEPLGGAHRYPTETILRVQEALEKYLTQFTGMSDTDLLQQRSDKFLNMTRLEK